ncbi:MAG TPA: sugar-binding transcriptional regulator [Anaerolineaceae bacterium]|nr:sugar-binding transcriptional regulator [Anaerolineaceae bacterium]
MANEKISPSRLNLLADVAEMYYLDGMDQSDIAQRVGVSRSMVSRMLTEARIRGIVEIKIIRQVISNPELERAIKEKFDIEYVKVVSIEESKSEKLLELLGIAAAEILNKHLKEHMAIGVAWGTAVSAVVQAFPPSVYPSIKIVQLVGAQGARNIDYDGHMIVKQFAEKVGGEGYYINAPYLCQSPEIAQSLRETKGIKETIDMGKAVDAALLGIGTTQQEYSSFYLSGLLSEEEIAIMRQNGVVGDIASNYFRIDGTPYNDEILDRIISIRLEDLKRIPMRLGIAGGSAKINAIIGALNSKLINYLVTDSLTARAIVN